MRRDLTIKVAAAALAVPMAAEAAAVSYAVLDPTAYQSFVGNWSPETGPLCAVISSQAQWDKVMHPAAVMGQAPVFGPPASTWDAHAVLLVAQVTPGGGTAPALRPLSVEQDGATVTVRYRFVTPRVASYQIKQYLALVVPKPVAANVVFIRNGEAACSLGPGAGDWLSPASAAR